MLTGAVVPGRGHDRGPYHDRNDQAGRLGRAETRHRRSRPVPLGGARISATRLAAEDEDADRVQDVFGRARAFLVRERAIITLVVAMAFARFLLADVHSYWYDEILSVDVYGRWNDSAVEAVRALGERSVHPPLYQFILYNWMTVFGESEVATRSLSNLYIAGATLLLYASVRTLWSRPVAFAAAATFSAMHVPIYYATETRSYAQSILLATLSMYGALRLVRSNAHEFRLGDAVRSWDSALLVIANTGLMLTHYYNAFLLAAQAAFLLVYAISRSTAPREALARLSHLGLVYGAVLVVFLVTWADPALHHFRSQSDGYEVEGTPASPLDNLLSSVISPNIRGPGSLVLVLLLSGGALAIAHHWSRRTEPDEHSAARGWSIAYLLISATAPLFVAFLAFQLVGVERHSDRYFTLLAPSLAGAIVVIAHGLVRLVGATAAQRWAGWWNVIAPLLAAGIVALALAPGAAAAATERVYDWRSLTYRVIEIVEADDGHTYVIYQSGFRQVALMNHYFERMHDTIRVEGTIRRSEQERDGPMDIEEDQELIEEHDYLIVVFPHLPVDDYPGALERLDGTYRRHLTQVDDHGRGLLVYRTNASD